MKKVLICDPIAEEGVELLKEAGLDVDEKFDLSEKELVEEIPPYHGMIVRSATKVTEEVLDTADNLRVIGRPGVGLDQIDVDYAKELGIEVHNTPDAPTVSVAELTMAHLLACFRDLVAGANSLREGKWIKKKLKGRELFDKTLGIIGYGRIGRAVAERANAFGMEIIAQDVREIEDPGPAEMVDLDTLLRGSDAVTVHVPLNESTRNLIDREELERMKDSAVLVDVSRGGVVNEKALYEALEEQRIGFACKDVFEVEPPKDSPLLDLDNFHATPHIGAQTYEAQRRAAEKAARKVIEELEG